MALAVLAAGAVLVDRVVLTHAPPPRPRAVVRAAQELKGPPTVPVAVLNATTVNGAAYQLASELHGRGVSIAMTGNMSVPLASGLDILYARGELIQAERLQRLLGGRAHAPLPIGSAVSAATRGAPVVVVIA